MKCLKCNSLTVHLMAYCSILDTEFYVESIKEISNSNTFLKCGVCANTNQDLFNYEENDKGIITYADHYHLSKE